MRGPEGRDGWAELSREEKRRRLFLEQKRTLDTLLAHGALTREQHDRSLRGLREKMGMPEGAGEP